MKKIVNVAGNIIAAVFAAIGVLCISVTITVMFRPLYYFEIDYLDIPQMSGMSETVIRANYDVLIDYNLLGGPSELNFPDLIMSQQGRIHFEEVKDIFIFMQIFSIAAVILLVLWIVAWVKKKSLSFKWMKFTGIVIAIIASTCGCALIIDWDWAFTAMHTIFFRNDYWIFDATTDPVIRILPEEFFMHCGIMIIILALIQIIILQLVYRRLKHGGNKI
jgi:integral membrane protein (TIGR01906 family)